jgi:membrane-associated phospholipid phosphatase
MTKTVEDLGVTCLATEARKYAVGEKRPNSDSKTNFPSGHTAAAFTMATVLADYRPEYKWPAYITASAIGYLRVEVGSHYWRDVIGGAALGCFVGKHFTNDHVTISPEGIGYKWKW